MHSDLEKMRFSLTSKGNKHLSFDDGSISEDEDFQNNCPVPQYDTSDVLTIEGLRKHYNSCSENSKGNKHLSFDDGSTSKDEDFQNNCPVPQYDTSDVLTIEGLRKHYNSCSDCGVCWYDDHVSLDCSQCGGYALCRPCPKCNGQCGKTWRRDVTASHRNKKAEWIGSCSSDFQWDSSELTDSNNLSENKNINLEQSYHHHHLSPKCKKFTIKGAHVL